MSSKSLTELLDEYLANEINAVGFEKTQGQLELLKSLIIDLADEINVINNTEQIIQQLERKAFEEGIMQRYYSVERLGTDGLCREIKLCTEKQLNECVENFGRGNIPALHKEISKSEYYNAKLKEMPFYNGVDKNLAFDIMFTPEIYWGITSDSQRSYAERQLNKPPLPDIVSLTWNKDNGTAYLENYNPGMFVESADFTEINNIINSFGTWKCGNIADYAAALTAAKPYITQAEQHLPAFDYETAKMFFRDNHGGCTDIISSGYHSFLCWDDKLNYAWLELNENAYQNDNLAVTQKDFDTIGAEWGVRPCSDIEQYNALLSDLIRNDNVAKTSDSSEQDMF